MKEFLSKKYPAGTRIRLRHMDDMQAPAPGTEGTVTGIDDACNIHMKWDTGSTLSLIYEEDDFEIIEETEK